MKANECGGWGDQEMRVDEFSPSTYTTLDAGLRLKRLGHDSDLLARDAAIRFIEQFPDFEYGRVHVRDNRDLGRIEVVVFSECRKRFHKEHFTYEYLAAIVVEKSS